jgi:hypothetical protein
MNTSLQVQSEFLARKSALRAPIRRVLDVHQNEQWAGVFIYNFRGRHPASKVVDAIRRLTNKKECKA